MAHVLRLPPGMELLPCPFCGSANVKVEVDPLIAGRVSVFCKS